MVSGSSLRTTRRDGPHGCDIPSVPRSDVNGAIVMEDEPAHRLDARRCRGHRSVLPPGCADVFRRDEPPTVRPREVNAPSDCARVADSTGRHLGWFWVATLPLSHEPDGPRYPSDGQIWTDLSSRR